MFGRATITLGIGRHSSFILLCVVISFVLWMNVCSSCVSFRFFSSQELGWEERFREMTYFVLCRVRRKNFKVKGELAGVPICPCSPICKKAY